MSVAHITAPQRQYLLDRGLPGNNSAWLERNKILYVSAGQARRRLELASESTADFGEGSAILLTYPGRSDEYTVAIFTGARGGKCCPPDGPCPIYCPRAADLISATPRVLYVCESPVKALAMAELGYCAVGGNGVWGVVTRAGWAEDWPHELIESGTVTQVMLVPDSDVATNAHVLAAMSRLSTALRERYAGLTVSMLVIPPGPDGGKQGIDDWLAQDRAAAEAAIREGGIPAPSDPVLRAFDELNEQYSVVRTPTCVVEAVGRRAGAIYTAGDFVNVIERARIHRWVDNKGRPKERALAKDWIAWADRREVDRLDYVPGTHGLSDDGQVYSTWVDDGPEAIEGDVTPFMAMLRNAVPDWREVELLLQLWAWKLQNRGVLCPRAIALVGSGLGTGKSWTALILSELLGRSNSCAIAPRDLTGFTDAWAAKEVRVMDDCLLRPADQHRVREITSSEHITHNQKGVKAYQIHNRGTFVMTSNSLSSLGVDPMDRRYHVVEFAPALRYESGDAHWLRLQGWVDEGGLGALRWHLEAMELGEFTPRFQPEDTAGRAHVIEASATPEDEFIRSLSDDWEAFVADMGGRRFFTAVELYAACWHGEEANRGEITRFAQRVLTKWMRKAHGGRHVRLNGERLMLWTSPEDAGAELREIKASFGMT